MVERIVGNVTFFQRGRALSAFAELAIATSNLSAGIRGIILVNPKDLKLTRLLRT